MKEILLTQGYVAIVDDEDYERVSAHKWCVCVMRRADGIKLIYGIRNIVIGERMTTQYLHRFVSGATKGVQIDHINGDGLDNRICNLRICTNSQNQMNQHKIRGRSNFKGVCWHSWHAKWMAQIRVGGTKKNLGYFTSELDAAHAYDAAALKYFGEFARINIYGEDE